MRMVVVALAGMLATAGPALARQEPLTVDVILGLESFGRVAIDPSGAVAVFEERRARGDLPRHDLEAEGANRYARLYRIDLDAPDHPRPLLTMDEDAGYSVGAFSPSGRRLAVFRLRNDEWRLGIVEIAAGEVVWTDVAPELGLWGRSLEWLTDDTLVVLGMPDGALPPRLAGPRAEQARLLALRAAATAGSPAAITVGEDGPPEALPPRRLWRIDAVTGEAAAIADGPFLDLEVSPDGRYAALLLDGPLLPPPSADTASEVRRARGLELVELTTGAAVRPPEAGNISTSLLAWSPASDALLVATIGDEPARLLTVAPDGAARDVTPAGAHPTTPIDFQGMATAEGGWLGETPIFKGRSGSREGWFVAGADALPLLGLSPDARLVAEGRSSVLFTSGGRVVRLGADGELPDLGAVASAVNPRGPFGLRAQSGPLKAAFAVAEGGVPPARLRREADARPHLPYARHVSDHVVALDSGALMMVFQIDGASFETADARNLNDWHVKLNQAWRNLADDRLAVWHHVVRRPVDLERSSGFRSTFAGELGALYDDRVAGRQLWINELFVTLVLHPGRDAGDRAAALAKRLKAARRSDSEVEVAHIRRIEEAGRDLAQYLGRYAPRRLGLYERDGLWFSEPMEVMRLVLTGRRSPVPIVFGHLASAVYTVRAIFGRETLELRDAADARYAGVLAIKEYPATTRPGLWDDLLSVRFGFVISQSFAFLSKASARTVMERKQNQMVSARDRAASQIAGLSEALDDLVSNRFVMGEHQASILVHGDTPAALADQA